MSGFLHPVHKWEIQVGQGIVYAGTNKRDANAAFRRLIKTRKGLPPEIGDHTATLLCDGATVIMSAQIERKTCDCGTKFFPYSKTQKFCSERCQIANYARFRFRLRYYQILP